MRGPWAGVALGLALSGCAEPAADSGSPEPVPACATCALTDDHTYTYGATLTAEVVPVAAGQNAVVRWDDLTEDVHGHRHGEQFTVEQAQLVAFLDLSPAEVTAALATDSLNQSEVSLFATCTPTDASCALQDFSVLGSTFELDRYFTEGSGTWLVILSSSFEAGGHAFVFLEPRDDAVATTVAVGDDSSALSVDVDLDAVRPLRPAADGATVLDWSAVTRDGLGNALAPHQLDRLVVGRYPGRSLDDLEQAVFDLERVADPLWELDVTGTSAATLDDIAGGGDLPLPAADGASLVAVYCSACLNPAPKIVGVLVP